jgi:hypothetical protein
MKTAVSIVLVAVSMAVSAANIVLVGDSTLAPRSEKDRVGSWGDALKPAFDTTHPAKAGAKRFAELFITDVKARSLPVAKLFK